MLFTARILLACEKSRHVRVQLCNTMVLLLTKKAVQTYLCCVPIASTMDRFGMTATSECYCVPIASTMDRFRMTAASECYCVPIASTMDRFGMTAVSKC